MTKKISLSTIKSQYGVEGKTYRIRALGLGENSRKEVPFKNLKVGHEVFLNGNWYEIVPPTKPYRYLWQARIYVGGDSPRTVTFDTKRERDLFLKTYDYCNAAGKIRSDHFFTEDIPYHYGDYLVERDGKFYYYDNPDQEF